MATIQVSHVQRLQHQPEGGNRSTQQRSELRNENDREFKARHDFIVQGLNSLPGVSCLPVRGLLYAFADVKQGDGGHPIARTMARSPTPACETRASPWFRHWFWCSGHIRCRSPAAWRRSKTRWNVCDVASPVVHEPVKTA